jgi:hypothetical protein
VLCGGVGGAAREVTEDEILELEREAFVSLCGEPKSLERIQYMLMNNKPLRNSPSSSRVRARAHPYRAVAVDPRRDLPGVDTRHVGRVLAHELSHALGVPHPMGSSSDAFDDTDSNEPNLMNTPPSDVTADEAWERLTPQQVFAMTRSALLE